MGTGEQKGYLGLPLIPRGDFNRIAATMPGASCWNSDEVNPGRIDPQEVGRCDKSVGDGFFCGQFPPLNLEQQYRQIAERHRQEFVQKELAKTVVVTVRTDLKQYKLTPAQKKMVAAYIEAGKGMDEWFQLQQGGLIHQAEVKSSGTADDREFLRRYQTVWCDNDDPYCNAVSSLPPRTTPLYSDAKIDCTKIAGEELANPFSAVVADPDGKLRGVSYTDSILVDPALKFKKAWVVALLKQAAAKARAAGETATAEYTEAVAAALLSRKPFPYSESDQKWVAAKDSRFFLRIGPDEYIDDHTCGMKAQFHMRLGIKNPALEAGVQKTMDRKQELERYLAGLIGNGYQERPIQLHTPEFMDVIMESGNSRGTVTGTHAAQTLPNWCGEDGKGECQTRAMMYVNKTALAYKNPAMLEKLAQVLSPRVMAKLDPSAIGDTMVLHELSHNFGPQNKDYGAKLGEMLGRLEELKAEIGAIALRPIREQLGLADPATREQEMAGLLAWCLGHIKRGIDKGDKFYENKSPYIQLASVIVGYFTERGVFTYDATTGQWDINYDKAQGAARDLYRDTGQLYMAAHHETPDSSGGTPVARKGVQDFFLRYTSGAGLAHLHLDRITTTIVKAPVTLFDYEVTGL